MLLPNFKITYKLDVFFICFWTTFTMHNDGVHEFFLPTAFLIQTFQHNSFYFFGCLLCFKASFLAHLIWKWSVELLLWYLYFWSIHFIFLWFRPTFALTFVRCKLYNFLFLFYRWLSLLTRGLNFAFVGFKLLFFFFVFFFMVCQLIAFFCFELFITLMRLGQIKWLLLDAIFLEKAFELLDGIDKKIILGGQIAVSIAFLRSLGPAVLSFIIGLLAVLLLLQFVLPILHLISLALLHKPYRIQI